MFRYLKKVEDKILNKLTWQNNFLYIEGYKEIIGLEEEKIELSNYIIVGKNLKIISFDGHLIHIQGQIDKIEKRG